MSYSRSKTGSPNVGDTVMFDFGAGLMVTGVVVEDRGHIGAEGRRLWRVRMQPEPGAEQQWAQAEHGPVAEKARQSTAVPSYSPDHVELGLDVAQHQVGGHHQQHRTGGGQPACLLGEPAAVEIVDSQLGALWRQATVD